MTLPKSTQGSSSHLTLSLWRKRQIAVKYSVVYYWTKKLTARFDVETKLSLKWWNKWTSKFQRIQLFFEGRRGKGWTLEKVIDTKRHYLVMTMRQWANNNNRQDCTLRPTVTLSVEVGSSSCWHLNQTFGNINPSPWLDSLWWRFHSLHGLSFNFISLTLFPLN